MVSFTKESVLKALSRIDANPEIINGRESTEYDLIVNDRTYPPILVLSEASKILGGEELVISDFSNSTKTAFKILRDLGFEVEKKRKPNVETFLANGNKIWIEKTIVENRKDRMEGDYALGKRLWSPRRSKAGGDIYALLREISLDDIILHLTDNNSFTGVSRVKSGFKEGQGVKGTEWEGEAYIVELYDYQSITPLSRKAVLNQNNRATLEKIKSNHRVFYNSDLNLNQGAYITECPTNLADLINIEYHKRNGSYIPYLPPPTIESSTNLSRQNKIMDIREFIASLKDANLIYNDSVVLRFICSLLTKPFVIVTGLSGSGKTKLVQAFVHWICEEDDQFCIIPVGADWTNREPLLGYPNALENGKYMLPDNGALKLVLDASKNENQTKPYFLILDEMNLSHVERYFADFLSAMESMEAIPLHSETAEWDKSEIPARLKLPRNLFIVGTVNIDETTYMFSPKVLDRANVIEFKVSEENMQAHISRAGSIDLKRLKSVGANSSQSFIQLASGDNLPLSEEEQLKKSLMDFFNELKKIGAEFGYRTASEILRYASIVKHVDAAVSTDEIIDTAIMQKLLPKVHGSRRKLEPILKVLGSLCLAEGIVIDDVLNSNASINFSDSARFKFPISLEKIQRMYRSLLDNGFTSYAEA